MPYGVVIVHGDGLHGPICSYPEMPIVVRKYGHCEWPCMRVRRFLGHKESRRCAWNGAKLSSRLTKGFVIGLLSYAGEARRIDLNRLMY
jgi:hypothetical protein